MSALGLLMIASLAGAAALIAVVSAWQQPRPPLASTIHRLHRRPGPVVTTDVTPDATESAGRTVARVVGVDTTASWNTPLKLVERTLERHLGLLAAAATFGLMAPSVLLLLPRLFGLATGPPPLLPLGFSLIGALLGPVVVHRSMLDRAEEIRRDLRHQLSAYLDMVSMLLAGNTGHEGALEQAARAGDGRLFMELRRRMRDVAATGQSMIYALSLTAEDLAMAELATVADATALAASEGAPVARTLTAKCSTLRSTLATDEEAAARIQTDKVTPPLVGMALIFMALIVYPALFSW